MNENNILTEKEDDESQAKIILFFVVLTVCFIVFVLYLYGYIFKPKVVIPPPPPPTTTPVPKEKIDFGHDFSFIVLNVLNTEKEVYYLSVYKGFFEEVVKSGKTFSEFLRDPKNVETYIKASDNKMPSFGNFGDGSTFYNNFLHLLSGTSRVLNTKIISLSKNVIINEQNFPIQFDFLGFNKDKNRYGVYTYQTLNTDTIRPTVSIRFENEPAISHKIDYSQVKQTVTKTLSEFFGSKTLLNDNKFSVVKDEEEELLDKVMTINPSKIFEVVYVKPTQGPPSYSTSSPPQLTYPPIYLPSTTTSSFNQASPVSNDFLNKSVKVVDTSSSTTIYNNNQIGDNKTQYGNTVNFPNVPQQSSGSSNALPNTYLRQPSMFQNKANGFNSSFYS